MYCEHHKQIISPTQSLQNFVKLHRDYQVRLKVANINERKIQHKITLYTIFIGF